MHEIRIPKLGLDAIDCEIRGWLVKVGDGVTPETPLLEVETEKVTVTIEAEVAGTVRELRAQPGQVVEVGSVVAVIENSAT